jgi:hypothetical protein
MKAGPLPPPASLRARRRAITLVLCVGLAPIALAQQIARRRRIAYFHLLPPGVPAAQGAVARFREGTQAHGLELPRAVLLRADRVIE